MGCSTPRYSRADYFRNGCTVLGFTLADEADLQALQSGRYLCESFASEVAVRR